MYSYLKNNRFKIIYSLDMFTNKQITDNSYKILIFDQKKLAKNYYHKAHVIFI